ncbi:MAG: site-2 protease family protein [bacterium JZ-2024 1]
MSLSLTFLVLLSLFISVMLHELAHGLVSEIQGDPTPRRMGRITLNPIRHIDPMGIILPLLLYILHSPVLIGWAKPVPIDPRYYRHPRFGLLLTAIAGPLTNIAIASLLILMLRFAPGLLPFMSLQRAAEQVIFANLLLAVFNLIPIPPLDGSRVLQFFLPAPIAVAYFALERWGFFILFLLFLFSDQVATTLYRITRLLFGWLFRFLA